MVLAMNHSPRPTSSKPAATTPPQPCFPADACEAIAQAFRQLPQLQSLVLSLNDTKVADVTGMVRPGPAALSAWSP